MRYCDTCGGELSEAEPFAVCQKCLFGTALSARERCGDPPSSADAPTPFGIVGVTGLFARRDFFQKYEILERVARGGQGEVWKVWDHELRRCVAMKRLSNEGLASPAAVYRFLAEAQIASQLEHPGILPIFDVGLDPDNRPFYTTQLLPGTTLGDVWRKVHDPACVEWTLPRAVELLVRVCDVMAHAHDRGVIHRDLKPFNVLVGSFGDVRVIDWGSAHVLPEARRAFEETFVPLNQDAVRTDRGEAMWGEVSSPLATAQSGQPVTVLFVPPEILLGQLNHLGPQTDVYSLGVMLYELLSGCLPYSNPDGSLPETAELRSRILHAPPAPVRKINPRASRDLAAICEVAMARSTDDRYRSMQELGDDLRASLEIRPVRARKPGPFLKLQRWTQRHAALVLLSALALLIATSAFFVTRGFMSQRDAARQVAALEKAERAARSGQWRDALRSWQEAEAAGYSDGVQLGLRRAEAWTILSSPRRARTELDGLARHSDLGERRAVVLLRIGEHELFEKTLQEQGIRHVREALAAGLSGADLAMARGLLADTTPEALALFREALQLNPYHHSAHRHSLGLEFLLGRREELRAHIRVFQVLFPDDPSSVFLEASDLAAGGQLAEAEVSLARISDSMEPELHAQFVSACRMLAAAAGQYDVNHLLAKPASNTNRAPFADFLTSLPLTAPMSTPTVFPSTVRLARLPCLQGYLEGAEALKALLVPGFTDPEMVVQKIKSSWRRHPEAFLPTAAAALLEKWQPPQGPRVPSLLATQAELFQIAADSPSVLPTLGKWARYHAATRQLELAQSGHTNAAAARQACLANARRTAEADGTSAEESAAFFKMAFALGDHDLARSLLSRWERLRPEDLQAGRSRIRLEIAAGDLGHALTHIDELLARTPDEPWALEQRTTALRELRKLLESASPRDVEP